MFHRIILGFAALVLLVVPAYAQDREVPYWATLRYDETNMRVGPSKEYKIDWVYRRKGLPVKVVRVLEGWRLIQEPDGTRGWVAQRQLNPERGALVVGDESVPMREDADGGSTIKWRLEPGVVGVLGDCGRGWCEFSVGNRTGYVRQEQLWGVGEP
ncbi:hypothetical protein K3152_04320 [Qipengyuania sp. 1NDH17]|uniref:SH3b domain-containing protein n=1 Tax=Qipengyuania polymorpha TaxID=2867234 RepID=A0ABS7J080_9SPHN|nr:SH3 domain-containing protein [Qipengyuania polymorpha]MBX7457464.1 hypothetical protein [Qipengyuania polymorpha]